MYKVSLKVEDSTYAAIRAVTEKMNTGEKESLSREFGEAVTAMACENLQLVFGIMTIENEYTQGGGAETQKVLDQITQQLQKYMPWAVSLFGNDRLKPVANYIFEQFAHIDGVYYIQYPISDELATTSFANEKAIHADDETRIQPAFLNVIKVIDAGVDELIRKPKKMLKFNIIADKTLNGVISMLTSLGYKRIEKLAKQANLPIAKIYITHFADFIRIEQNR